MRRRQTLGADVEAPVVESDAAPHVIAMGYRQQLARFAAAFQAAAVESERLRPWYVEMAKRASTATPEVLAPWDELAPLDSRLERWIAHGLTAGFLSK